MQALVLGVPNRFRGAGLIKACLDLGFSVEVLDGVDATEVEVDSLKAHLHEGLAIAVVGRQMTAGEICAAELHLRAAAIGAQSADGWVLVLEDDVELLPTALSMAKVLNVLPSTSIVVLQSRAAHPVFRDILRRKRGPFLRLACPPYGAFAYFLGRDAAIKLVEAYEDHGIDSVADWPLAAASSVQFWLAEPHCATHRSGPSLIASDRSRADSTRRTGSLLSALLDRTRRAAALVKLGIPVAQSIHIMLVQPALRSTAERRLLKRTRRGSLRPNT